MNIRTGLGAIMTSVPLLIGCGKSIEKSAVNTNEVVKVVVQKTAAELEKISIDSSGKKFLSQETLNHFANKYRYPCRNMHNLTNYP